MTHIFEEEIDAIPERSLHSGDGDYDALADLFLGDSPALRLTSEEAPAREPVAPPVNPAPRSRIEALVLGHLPVLAGAWAAQHARSLASETGRPVALLRLTAGHASLDLFGPRDLARDLTRTESLEDALAQAARLGARWLLRVDAPFELELASDPKVDEVCLLSGVDDAAIVAAYRTLKGLHEALPDDVESGRREISLRLMGAGEPETNEAQAKLARVSRAFLSCDVNFLPAAPRIDAGAGTTVFRGPFERDAAAALADIARLTEKGRQRHDAPPEAVEDQRPDPDPDIALPEPAEPAGAGPATETTANSLAARLDLNPLRVRCPIAESIELATDDRNRLHLLGLGAASAEDLLAAEGWARSNLALLRALAGGELSEILVRVLTSRPARDRRLLDGRFRVDLLHEVRLGGEIAWCCVPLNAEE